MGIVRCELPTGTVRKWSEKMRLAIVTLYGRKGDLSAQPCRGSRKFAAY